MLRHIKVERDDVFHRLLVCHVNRMETVVRLMIVGIDIPALWFHPNTQPPEWVA
jgi:hypothetical protein